MSGTEQGSHSLGLIDYWISFKLWLSPCSRLLKDAFMFLTWAVDIVLYESHSDGDLESGTTRMITKKGHRVMWYSLIIRQFFPADSLFAVETSQISDCILSSPDKAKGFADYNSFVDLGSVKFRHRLKSISCGQKHVPKLLNSLSRFQTRRRLTGNELSGQFYPPEPRGEDFRKWILVMETIFPNRSVYLGAIRVQSTALSKGPGPAMGTLSANPPRSSHTDLQQM